jgi:glucan-binding YG repeat protein
MKRVFKSFVLLLFFFLCFKSTTAFAAGESRSNPFPINQRVTLTHQPYPWDEPYSIALTVTDMFRGARANSVVYNENMFNEPETSTKEWMMIKVKLEVLSGPNEPLWVYDDSDIFEPYYPSGTPAIEDIFNDTAVLGDYYRSLEGSIFPGGYIEGWIGIRVLKSQPSVLLVHSRTNGSSGSIYTWFDTYKFNPEPGWNNINGKWYYYDEEISDYLTGWYYIDEKLYYFDEQGVMWTGWVHAGDNWYYLGTDGAMRFNWATVNGKWYYFGEDGAMRTGWQQIDNKWYVFDGSGAMKTGWINSSGKWYYLSHDGSMETGWGKVDNKWYYFGSNGVMNRYWVKIDNKWYYFAGDGAMKTGWQLISNKWYYFYSNGSMASNTTIDGCKLGSDGAWIK